MRRPAASQPLSTEESQLVSGAPVGGQVASFAPVWWSYQLKYWPASPRSMCSSEVTVCPSRVTASRWPMIPSRSAATVLHMYAPMLVGEIWTLVLPSALSTSAGRPLCGSVIAAIDDHVPSA
jgi:hypothetical protein